PIAAPGAPARSSSRNSGGCRAFLVAPIVHEVTSCQEEPSIRPTVGSFLRTVPGRRTLPSESLVVRRSCERWHAPGAANDGEVGPYPPADRLRRRRGQRRPAPGGAGATA